MSIRSDLLEEIHSYILQSYVDQENETGENGYAEYRRCIESVEQATIEQLWSLHKLIARGSNPEVIPCNPEDHLAVRFAGMYVGIEQDGYTHS